MVSALPAIALPAVALPTFASTLEAVSAVSAAVVAFVCAHSTTTTAAHELLNCPILSVGCVLVAMAGSGREKEDCVSECGESPHHL